MLLEKINQNLQQAFIQKKEVEVLVLRGLKSALHNLEIELKSKDKKLNEEMIIEVVQREAKKRREAIEIFKKGNREDLAEKELKELEIINTYLPEQLSEDDLRKIIQDKIKELGVVNASDFGRVMGVIMKEVKGKTDGNKVGEIVKELLA